jgi:hypothetical protein
MAFQVFETFRAKRDDFAFFFSKIESVDGLTLDVKSKTLIVSGGTPLYRGGARQISVISTGEKFFEITLKDSEGEFLSTDMAESLGMSEQSHTVECLKLREFLVFLVNQTW